MLPADVVARFQPSWPSETLSERFARITAEHATRVAIRDGDVALTFERAAELVERLAGHLVARGVEPGDVVSWQLPNWWESAIVHHAALRAGAVSNPLNPAFRARELTHVVERARPKVIVVPRAFRDFEHEQAARTLSVEHVLVARGGNLDGLLATPASAAPAPPTDPAARAVLLFTSGTTSMPKGVLHTHRSLLCEVDSFPGIHGLTPDDVYLGGAPIAHIAGLVYGVVVPFALGTATTFLERWDPARALASGATFMTGPPTFLLTMAEHATGPVPGFRLFSTGGASIPTAAVRDAERVLGCVVKRAYGSTEVPTLTATRVDDEPRARLETDGRVLGASEIHFENGEIWARAPEMFSGYLGAPDAMPNGWYATGDLGVLDDDGLLRVTGRLGDFIIRGGENISAKELEDLLLEHPAITDVAVVGMPDERLGERVCAVVVARDDVSLDDVTAFLRARQIATHKLPERVITVDALPRTESGKVRKSELRSRIG